MTQVAATSKTSILEASGAGIKWACSANCTRSATAAASGGSAAALPLGVAVIDASIKLFGAMYPRVPNKHRLQILVHFVDCIQKQAASKASFTAKQALQINIFTAVLGSLKVNLHIVEMFSSIKNKKQLL